MGRFFVFLTLVLSGTSNAFAGEADVIAVEVTGSGTDFVFSVTVEHGDTGWEHYADKWEVVTEEGAVLGTRVLAHPHVDEQPFTRRGSIAVPQGIQTVTVRAHDSVHGYGGAEKKVAIPGR